MANQEIVEIDGKKYVRFNKDEQPNVKAGDVLTFVEDNPHIPKGSQCTVVKVQLGDVPHETILWVDCPDGMKRKRFHWRFGVPLVEEDIVVCKDAKGTKLAFGIAYSVVDRKPGYLRVNGFGVWFKESRFVKQGKEAPVQPPAPKIDEDQKNLTELAEAVDKGGVGTASYRVVHQDGTLSDLVGDVCHARLFSTKIWGEFKRIKAIYLNFSGHLKQIKEDQHANYANFLDYVVNDSPWKDAFIPRDKAKLIQDGVALNVNRGKNLLVSAAIACRIASEYRHWNFLKEWSLLVEAGCSKNLAMVVASLVAFNREGYMPGNHHGGHHFFTDGIAVKDIMSFFNEGKMNEGEITNTTKDGRYQVFELIGKPTYEDDTLAYYIRKNYKLNVKKDLFGREVVEVKRSATWGYAPLAFCLSSIIK